MALAAFNGKGLNSGHGTNQISSRKSPKLAQFISLGALTLVQTSIIVGCLGVPTHVLKYTDSLTPLF
jgi:hypothetical protein